jgi:hypothetical protein
LPEALVVAVAAAGPVSKTVAPLPPAVGVIVPEILEVGPVWGVAVKFIPVMLAVVIVADWVVGLKVNPVLLGVTAYVPAGSPLKL